MNNEAEKRIAAKLAKTMAMLCVRNTHLETLHAGKTPETKAGDWSDVTVVDAYGQHIAWTDVSRISDRLCCTNPVRDSSRESSVVAARHEQTDTPDLQDSELAGV